MDMDSDLKYLYRVTRDITDGLILVDEKGTIVYVNPSAHSILANPALELGIKYAAFMLKDKKGVNDEFHQYVLDSIYDREKEHTGLLHYTCPDGNKRVLRVVSSFAYDEEGSRTIGIILQFSDVTKMHEIRQKYNDSTILLVALLAMLAVWNFACAIWDLSGRPIPGYIMTVIIEVLGAIVSVIVIKNTSITASDFGLTFKGAGRAVLIDGLFTAGILVCMIIAKLLIIRFVPDLYGKDAPLFFFRAWGMSETAYPLTVVVQEFLTRGAVQGSIRRVLPDKYAVPVAIILSSLFFGALHLYLGVAFMIGAFLLLSVFGIIYQKQKTIWGLCIPHYFLGLSLKLIFGVGL